MKLYSSLRLLAIFSIPCQCFSFQQPSFTLSTVNKAFNKNTDNASALRAYKDGSTLAEESLSNEEISRYSRHLVLSVSLLPSLLCLIWSLRQHMILTLIANCIMISKQDVGMTGQKALKNASVLVVGAGGLGSPCLLWVWFVRCFVRFKNFYILTSSNCFIIFTNVT